MAAFMKKIRKGSFRFRWLAATALLLLVCLLFPGRAEPDFGGFSGTSDYGGDSGRSGGGYSGGGYSGGGYRGSGGGWYSGPAHSGAYYFDDDFDSSISEVVITLMVLFILYQIFFASRSSSSKGRGYSDSGGGGATVPLAQARGLRPIDEYLRLDPNFDEARLRERIANLYVQMQDRWREKDIRSLRPYLTDAFYNQAERQLDALRRARQTDYTERVTVLQTYFLGYSQAGGMDCLTARLKTRIVSYILDDNTGRLVSGHKDREKFMEYEWDLVRKTGALTREDSGMRAAACPHCGAPLSINASAQCEYCGSVVLTANDDWALSAIRGVSQRTA